MGVEVVVPKDLARVHIQMVNQEVLVVVLWVFMVITYLVLETLHQHHHHKEIQVELSRLERPTKAVVAVAAPELLVALTPTTPVAVAVMDQ